MQSVDLSGLDKLDREFKHILEELPEARRGLHEEIGAAVLQNVRSEIDSSGLKDSHGNIKGWQESRVGSRGGYAAVSAVRGTGSGGSDDSPGAITNYLEHGHKIRPAGSSKSRATKPYVDGYHFYKEANFEADVTALEAAEKYADKIAQLLEG